jgi:hypothetical protein
MSEDYILHGYLDFNTFKTPLAGSIVMIPEDTAVGYIWEITDDGPTKLPVSGRHKETSKFLGTKHNLLLLLDYDTQPLILDLASPRGMFSHSEAEISGHYTGRWIRVNKEELKLDKTEDYDSLLTKLHNAHTFGMDSIGKLELYLASL